MIPGVMKVKESAEGQAKHYVKHSLTLLLEILHCMQNTKISHYKLTNL